MFACRSLSIPYSSSHVNWSVGYLNFCDWSINCPGFDNISNTNFNCLSPLGIVQVLPAVPNDEAFPQIPQGRLAREGSGLHRHLALLGGPNVDGAGAGQDLVLPPPLLSEGPVSLAPINVGAALDAGQLGAGFIYMQC